jgi:2-octaprenyl-6-methoxyphenol hydroxylase
MRERVKNSSDWDVAIVGGGMVGVSLALLLGEFLPASVRILLLEGFPLPEKDSGFGSAYSPSFDARSTALSYSSYQIYRKLGIWPTLAQRSCPIRQIHVSERGRFGSTLLQAEDYHWEAMGYVVENAWLGTALIQALHEQDRVVMRSPTRVEQVESFAGGYRLQVDQGEAINADLLVVADGADSQLRQNLGIDVERRAYDQHALIANIGHASDHRGCAYERFTDQGPLAMLPLLPDATGQHRSALVWTLPEAEHALLKECSEAEFLGQLQRRFGYRLGRLLKMGERFSYPLSLVQAREQVRHNLVLLGNAAHSLHPVAGQGFNLALRDCAALAEVLSAAGSRGDDLGELAVLQSYMDGQQADQERTVNFSDQLPGLFAHPDPALSRLRDMGLFALDLSPALKRQFVRQAAGVSALAASLETTRG